MATLYTRVTEREFIKKVLSGERDFSGIELVDEYDSALPSLTSFFKYNESVAYLIQQDLERNPINLSNSRLSVLKTIGLYLPYTNFDSADLEGAYLELANLEGSSFRKSMLGRACFIQANLGGSDFEGADFTSTNIVRAVLTRTKNLENALNLEHAIFGDTYITVAEQSVIEKALERRPQPFYVVS